MSKVEYQSLNGYIRAQPDYYLPRAQLEAHWEVHTHAVANLPGTGPTHIYKRCGYRLRDAWYGVAYRRGTPMFATSWKAPDAR